MFTKNLKNIAFFLIFMHLSVPLHADDSEIPSDKIQQFVDVYKKIKDQYVDEVDDSTLFNYAIEGMVSKLDPYSDYLSKDDFSELKIGTTGRFGGIGIEIRPGLNVRRDPICLMQISYLKLWFFTSTLQVQNDVFPKLLK